MAFALKAALGLQGLGDVAPSDQDESTDTPMDPTSTFVGPSLTDASAAAQQQQAALYAAQSAAMSGAVGVPVTGTTGSATPTDSSGIYILLIGAAVLFAMEAFKR